MEICTCSCHRTGGIHIAACCTSCDECGSERIPMDSYLEHKQKCKFNSIIGMTVEDAAKFVGSFKSNEEVSYQMRIVTEDGINNIVTMDLRSDRLNVEVLDGKVFYIKGIY